MSGNQKYCQKLWRLVLTMFEKYSKRNRNLDFCDEVQKTILVVGYDVMMRYVNMFLIIFDHRSWI